MQYMVFRLYPHILFTLADLKDEDKCEHSGQLVKYDFNVK
jgi:hypothetical protein